MKLFKAIKTINQTRKLNELSEELSQVRESVNQSLDYQNELLSQVNAAREKYKEDKDAQSALAVYEHALVFADPPLFGSNAHSKFLVGLYKKAGQKDKAIAFLNSVASDRSKYGYARMSEDKVKEELDKLK